MYVLSVICFVARMDVVCESIVMVCGVAFVWVFFVFLFAFFSLPMNTNQIVHIAPRFDFAVQQLSSVHYTSHRIDSNGPPNKWKQMKFDQTNNNATNDTHIFRYLTNQRRKNGPSVTLEWRKKKTMNNKYVHSYRGSFIVYLSLIDFVARKNAPI